MMSASTLITRQTELSGNLVQLCRYLRGKGYGISTSEESTAMLSLDLIPPLSKETYIATLKAVLAKTAFQFEHFEEHLLDFEDQVKRAVNDKLKAAYEEQKNTSKPKPVSLETLKNWLYNKPTEEETEIASYSSLETIAQKEFSAMSEEEIEFVLRLLEKLSYRLTRRKSRLRIKSKRRRHLDLRSTIRYNLRHGTEIRKLIYSKRKVKPLKLVILSDVSKSMDLYSRFFIQMLYAFQNSYDKIETFVFSTALHRISEMLDNYNYDAAFSMIADRVPQWSGGTKIGGCFAEFVDKYGHHHLDRKTIVIILSDGWDTGAPDQMKDAMRRMNKLSRKIIWLNPLAGHSDFSPEVIGLQSALPYVDDIYPAHNLESLRNILYQL